jgi:hypothetical protein
LKAGLELHPRPNYIELTSAFTARAGPRRTISMATFRAVASAGSALPPAAQSSHAGVGRSRRRGCPFPAVRRGRRDGCSVTQGAVRRGSRRTLATRPTRQPVSAPGAVILLDLDAEAAIVRQSDFVRNGQNSSAGYRRISLVQAGAAPGRLASLPRSSSGGAVDSGRFPDETGIEQVSGGITRPLQGSVYCQRGRVTVHESCGPRLVGSVRSAGWRSLQRALRRPRDGGRT